MDTLFAKGGFMVYPIFICSIIALAVIAERCCVIFKVRYTDEGIFRQALELIRADKKNQALKILRESKTSFYSLYEDILKNSLEKEQEKTALNRGSELIENLEKRLPLLSTVVAVTPIMGLLGTVLGMIRVFSSVAAQTTAADISVLAGGIWEALITTAAGLAVAIPALIAYRLLKIQIDKTVSRVQRKTNMLISAAGSMRNGSVNEK